jgi:hypothetical protein
MELENHERETGGILRLTMDRCTRMQMGAEATHSTGRAGFSPNAASANGTQLFTGVGACLRMTQYHFDLIVKKIGKARRKRALDT